LPANRLETLGDGVFAIAMTILVLEIGVPEHGNWSTLVKLWPKFASYALSFIMLGVLWIGHYYQFHYIKRTDRTLIWLDLLFLLTVTFLPFATGVLGNSYEDRISVALYGGTILASGTALLLQWNHAVKVPGLLKPETPPQVIGNLRERILVGMLASAISIGVGFIETRISFAVFLIMPIVYMLPSRIERQARRQ
jgi:uncharacterized membrane protein